MNSDYNPLDSYNDSGINEIGMYSIDASDFSSGNELMLPRESFEEEYISVSTIFHPGSAILSLAGPHTFPLTPMLRGWLLAPGPIAQVPESAVILTSYSAPFTVSHVMLLHPVSQIYATLWTGCHLNGLDPARIIQKGTPLYTLLMTRHVPHHPLMDASPYLLGVGLEDIDDASACRMGPLYLKRLSLLNANRVRTLKCIVPQQRRKGCSIAIQKAMGKDWACIVTQLTWDAKSNISPHFIRDTCYRAGEGLPCQECRMNWNDCADAIAKQWARVEFTI
ncbi:hypothetical protein BKA70DRAFT_1360302 [Coprinopsis sp. MPI-PUGE-AT-0042]|nr:hypothetical protein BKA70DRAFT_1360302 [Coprinopsis sp. MPI-PUGE-AT-0042]